MGDENLLKDKIDDEIKKIAEFLEANSLVKIINKLTDYAEIIPEGKLAGIVNFNYQLNSSQTNIIIEILLQTGALTKIYNIASKGSKDLEEEFISNIFSDSTNPSNISSYISLRTVLENRISHQIQQYNMNMNRHNTTQAMSITELKGHMKTYSDLSSHKVSVSSKSQHGVIAASLHDAYVIIINKNEWWNDKTYMKFYFNEDDPAKKNMLITRKTERQSLSEVNRNVKYVVEKFASIKAARFQSIASEKKKEQAEQLFSSGFNQQKVQPQQHQIFSDKMLMTPFGKQYGNKIDSIISEIFSEDSEKKTLLTIESDIQHKAMSLFSTYVNLPKSISDPSLRDDIRDVSEYLIWQDYGIKLFAEKFLYNKKESFAKFFSGENKTIIELFVNDLYTVYFDEKFESLFKIVKSLDMKKFACAYIMKRIYFKYGDSLSKFSYFLIKAIANVGGIKEQQVP